MTIKTEGVHAGEFLLSEANGSRSRENIVITAGSGRLVAGTLIAPITAANALSATAAAGNHRGRSQWRQVRGGRPAGTPGGNWSSRPGVHRRRNWLHPFRRGHRLRGG
ncbi:head decoration protein [Pseudomonas aeruginosa]|uniref:head decoration protein n=1 Tax=Pseudomonas aeruginosa TaxID=287 RepID=UPI003459FD95